MKALVYHGPGQKSWADVPEPRIIDETDAIVGVELVTIWISALLHAACLGWTEG